MTVDRDRLADRGLRFAAWLTDAAIAGAVFLPFNPLLYDSRPGFGLGIALTAASMPLLFLYLVLFDGGKRGATPGKRITKLRVIDADSGGAIGYRRAAVRRAVYYLGGICLYLGWIWVFFNERRQAWHDMAANTLVVSVRAPEPSPGASDELVG